MYLVRRMKKELNWETARLKWEFGSRHTKIFFSHRTRTSKKKKKSGEFFETIQHRRTHQCVTPWTMGPRQCGDECVAMKIDWEGAGVGRRWDFEEKN